MVSQVADLVSFENCEELANVLLPWVGDKKVSSGNSDDDGAVWELPDI